MSDAETAEMPGEVGAELGAMVGLDPLNGCRESAQFVDELGRRADRVVRIDSEDRYRVASSMPADALKAMRGPDS